MNPNDGNQPTRQSQGDSRRQPSANRGGRGRGRGRSYHNNAGAVPPSANGGGGSTFHPGAVPPNNYDTTSSSSSHAPNHDPGSQHRRNYDPSSGRGRGGGGGRQNRSNGGRQDRGRIAKNKQFVSSVKNSNTRKPVVSKAPKRDGSTAPRNNSPRYEQHQQQQNPSQTGSVARYPTSRSNSSGAASNQSSSSNANNNNQNIVYPPYWDSALCLLKYSVRDVTFLRGKLRVLPGKDSAAFVACDRGSQAKDVIIPGALERNRALDGDTVYVQLMPDEVDEAAPKPDSDQKPPPVNPDTQSDDVEGVTSVETAMGNLDLVSSNATSVENADDDAGDVILIDDKIDEGGDIIVMGGEEQNWQDDPLQMELWNPVMTVPKPKPLSTLTSTSESNPVRQRRGRVVYVIPPKSIAMQPSEINPADRKKSGKNADAQVKRTIVGRLQVLKRQTGDIYLLIPMNRSLPEFKCLTLPPLNDIDANAPYKAEYIYGSWMENHRWPPCYNVQPIVGGHEGTSTVEMETAALLPTYGVDHGEFTPEVLQDVDSVVQSGVYTKEDGELEWKPTPDMLLGRRDYRNQRIFTIDPTTARDLDDALHIQTLPDGRIEIGVHIADVSHFVKPDSEVDLEAERRATTVYLVDRVIPMLPRPLCEIACSLNENVERLAFSCVWTMHPDGNLAKPNQKQDIWYGRSVIKSCARLDYATAQNIIDRKIATGEAESDIDEDLWPLSRRPTGGHTVDQVAFDVRLMHKVAMARRRLRFQSGALALNGVKLTFQLDSDGETPMLCSAYPIRDSNRLVEEYMLLANYFVAQRLATNAGGLALLRRHPPPLMDGIQKVVDIAKVSIGFDIDATSSETLQKSLNRLTRECDDEIVLQCVTALLTTPMQPALYFAVGETSRDFWQHFALHIPFYTHFTSPIRRYPDVLVHRLLQATIEGDKAVESFPLEPRTLQMICDHCNEKKEASRAAQQRGDIVFLALYLKRSPLKSQLGVVLSVGVKTFTIFVPSVGLNSKVFLDEHDKNVFTFTPYDVKGDKRIKVEPKGNSGEGPHWTTFDIKVFTKLLVTCACKDKFPIDVKIIMEGPWTAERG